MVILLQVVVLKNLELGVANWWITPFIYFYLILDLPVRFNPLYAMLYGGFLGFVVDIFWDTYGMHASAAIMIGFVRFYFLPLVLPRDGFDMNSSPQVINLGRLKYGFYLLIMSFVYHIWFFMVEKFSMSSFLLRMSQALISCLVAVALMYIIHYLYLKDNRR